MNREVFASYLNGEGIEFGALHNPLPLDPARCHVLYVDRLTKSQALQNFPELQKEAERIVEPDIILNVEDDEVLRLANLGLNFVVANHVIEHLVNPLRWLERMATILREGGVLYLAVPNKECTFDKPRALTTNEHIWTDYCKGETELSLEHLNDFLLNMTKDHIEPDRRARMYFQNDELPDDLEERERVYALHRVRSIHVHVWNRASFEGFLKYAIAALALPFEIASASDTVDEWEMIFILRRTALVKRRTRLSKWLDILRLAAAVHPARKLHTVA